jgi:branched-chain amino acid transport system permease protein
LTDQFWSNTVNGVTIGAIYALIALGYTLVYGVLRLINFAHSEVFMVGILGSLFGLHAIGIDQGHAPLSGFGLAGALLVMVLAGMLFSGVLAVGLERLAYRPLRKRGAPRLAFLITAIGASLFVQEFVSLRYGAEELPFPRVLNKTTVFHLFGADVRSDKLLVVLAAVVFMVALDRFVNGTKLGRGIRAVAQDVEAAQLMGVNVSRIIMVTFLLGGLLAGVAGALYGVFFETVRYNFGFIPGIKAFTAAVMGGIGNIRGALLGGLVLGLLESYGASFLGGRWTDVFAFTMLVLVLMVRPTGLLGENLGRSRA